jgi:MFS family permease
MAKFINKLQEYPRQLWLIFFGRFLATSGVSMIWPFLLLYASKKLDLPLTQVATLMTINAISGIVASLVAGPLVDRIGRKWIMVIALFAHACMYTLMAGANSYLAFAGLMALSGIANPLYRIGAEAMIADLVEPKKRAEAFALVRWSNNLGVAMGPVIGGYLVVISYTLTFRFAAGGMLLYCLLLVFFARETLPTFQNIESNDNLTKVDGGYKRIFQDKTYLATIGVIAIGWITAAMMWILLPVYSSQQYNIPENQYGIIPSTNATMVVLFQLRMTKFTKRFSPMRMMALGMVFYGIGTGLVALSSGFWGFWFSMVIITIGELIFAPTSSTFVANAAPADMRGRYMSIFNLVQRFAAGTGPVFGGWLSDTIHPRATWVGGLVAGLSSSFGLLLLSKRSTTEQTTQPVEVPKQAQ